MVLHVQTKCHFARFSHRRDQLHCQTATTWQTSNGANLNKGSQRVRTRQGVQKDCGGEGWWGLRWILSLNQHLDCNALQRISEPKPQQSLQFKYWTLTSSPWWAKKVRNIVKGLVQQESDEATHTRTHTRHPNTKIRLQFPFGSGQMASCDLTEGGWTSGDRPKLLGARPAPPAKSLNSMREPSVTRPGEGGVMYSRSGSARLSATPLY